MKTTQRGFIIPLLLAIVAILLAGGGVYLYGNNASTILSNLEVNSSLSQEAAVQTATSSPDNKSSRIILLVEAPLVDGLSTEMQTYSKDVKKELGLDTIIKSVSPTDTVFTLKSYVTDFYNKNGLAGVLIIGNVPTGNFYNSTIASGTVFDSQGLVLSDSIYQDFLNACIYSAEKQAFDYKNVECQTGVTVPKYWIARLTPNATTASNLDLLRNYFSRNHAFRTGQTIFSKNFLTYAPILSTDPDPSAETTFKTSVAGYGTYSPSQYNYIDYGSANSDSDYLSAMATPGKYEAILFNGHGLPTFHQKNINSNPSSTDCGKDVCPKNLTITSSSFVYASLLSCSVGRFTTPDYLAGKYLFGGGLIVTAASVPVFASIAYDKDSYEALSEGVPFYKVFAFAGLSTAGNTLGDPTLKLRYGIQNASTGPHIVLSSKKDLTFSKSKPDQTITIKNTSKKPLLFAIRGKYFQQKNSSYLTSFSFNQDANIITAENKPNTLLPGKTTTISIQSKYFFPYDTIPAGTYTGKLFIVSNDASDPFVEIGLSFLSTKK